MTPPETQIAAGLQRACKLALSKQPEQLFQRRSPAPRVLNGFECPYGKDILDMRAFDALRQAVFWYVVINPLDHYVSAFAEELFS